MRKLKAIILFLASAFCVGCATACIQSSYDPNASVSSENSVESSVESSVEVSTESSVEVSSESFVESSEEPSVESSVESSEEASNEPWLDSEEPSVESSEESSEEESSEPAEESSESESSEPAIWESSEESSEESSFVVEESSSIDEESSSIVEESSSIIEENSSVVEESSSIVEENSSVDEDSSSADSSPDEEKEFGEGYETITIAEALELCGEEGNVTTEQYYIIATIDTVTNPTYGAMIISDETGSISVYNTKNIDGTFYSNMEEKPYAGDKVLLSCILQNHNGTKEIKQAYIVDFMKVEIEVDEGDYTKLTIAEARNAEDGALVKVTGVVAQITYANGKIPSGVILIDETQSIYLYDGDLAGRVSEGNTITILASKTHWILETEQAAASKHGYKGCNQLTDVILVSNDEGNSPFPTSGIVETTIKEIMDTPVTEDITSIVYKVNALVTRADGNGFINYYFNDIDGETGSYTYTQCNGSDFAWLDEFDGKICTVYLTVLNAKSSATGCVYRLLPVEVIDEGYVFDVAGAAEFAVKYYGVDQFESVYTADPALLLNDRVSSELLGFENATLSYATNNSDVVYFEETAEGVVMHCGELGTAIITVTAVYNEIVYSEEVEISVEKAEEYDYITVAEAIATAVDTEGIIVKGIVGPSVVNKNGFYLFGEDGSMIAVLVDSTDYLVGLEIGHEIILQGTRERYVKNDASVFAGQTCIVNAKILVNNYGSYDYSTAKFIEATGADFRALDINVDYSTTVYVIKATVTYTETAYYSSLNVVAADGNKIALYMSGAGQYSWMKDYYGKEIMLEVAACNWNDKTDYWRGCVLAIRNEDGSKVYNTLNFDTY